MSTIAWVMILAAVLLVRGVAKGRVEDLPGDLRDMLMAALTGDLDALKEAAGRTGEGLKPPAGGDPVPGTTPPVDGSKGLRLLAEARRLGAGKRYVYGGTFTADSAGGDCSGLVWRAGTNLGFWKVPRFTTFTFDGLAPKYVVKVADPQPGDIVLWDRGGHHDGHMGIVSGGGQFYSALSRESGIREAPIRAISGRVTYYRLV